MAVDVNLLQPFKLRDCTTGKLAVGELEDNSGWHFKLRILGDLEDGSQKNIVIHLVLRRIGTRLTTISDISSAVVGLAARPAFLPG